MIGVLRGLGKGTLYSVAMLLAAMWGLMMSVLAVAAALTIVGIPAAGALVMIGGAPMAGLLKKMGLISR